MKKKTFYSNYIYLIAGAYLIFSITCKKDDNSASKTNKLAVTTLSISSITQTTATSGGVISSDNGTTITEKGVCWSTSQNPTINNSKTSNGGGTANFSSSITGLTPNTTYYVRAFATIGNSTTYGIQISFKTTNGIVITTAAAIDIKHTTATSGGNINSVDGKEITEKGVCWSTSQNPTINNSKTSDGNGTAIFSSSITGLTANTTYYVRAFATTGESTTYGTQISFKTTDYIVPQVSTSALSSITLTKALGGGYVISDNGFAIEERGICYSATANPTIANTKISTTGTIGSFTSSLISLISNTTYHVRAYAITSEGVGYGTDISFTTVSNTLTDAEGNNYKVVEIGNQVWMAENLRVTKYLNGDLIGTTASATTDITGETYSKYQWACNGDENNVAAYGRLYTWFAATDTRKICPTGWHLPSETDFMTLEMTLGMSQAEAQNLEYRGTNEGSKLAGNALLWNDGTLESDPEFGTSGFNALPAGYRQYNGTYINFGKEGFWWSAQENGSIAYSRVLDFNDTRIYRYSTIKTLGFSVRCVKDN
jgi:uncharacterized protein (TIGR02145 family)